MIYPVSQTTLNVVKLTKCLTIFLHSFVLWRFSFGSKSLSFVSTWNYLFVLKQLDMWCVVRKP